jgi:predicted transcriptional regulator
LSRKLNAKLAKRIRRFARVHGGDEKMATRFFSRAMTAEQQKALLAGLRSWEAGKFGEEEES